jgi:hypothetical protein
VSENLRLPTRFSHWLLAVYLSIQSLMRSAHDVPIARLLLFAALIHRASVSFLSMGSDRWCSRVFSALSVPHQPRLHFSLVLCVFPTFYKTDIRTSPIRHLGYLVFSYIQCIANRGDQPNGPVCSIEPSSLLRPRLRS